MATFFKFVFVALLSLAAFFYYNLVLPGAVSTILALMIFVYAILKLGRGFEIKTLFMAGATISLWPLSVILINLVTGSLTEPQVIGLSWTTAILGAMLSFALAEKRDKARDAGTISMALIILYILAYTMLKGDGLAKVFACVGLTCTILAIRQQLILPPKQEMALGYAAGIAGAGGVINVLFVLIG